MKKNLNKKIYAAVCRLAAALLCCFALACVAAAAETTLYVDSAGGEGVYACFSDAVKALGGQGGTVVLRDKQPLPGDFTIPEQSGDLRITAENGGALLLYGDLTFEKNTNANCVTLDVPVEIRAESAAIFGGFNSLHFTERFTVSGTLDFYGGVDAPQASDARTEAQRSYLEINARCVTELPYSITVDGGSFRKFMGGNRRTDEFSLFGSIAAPLTVTVNGGSFGTPTATGAAVFTEDSFSLSGMSILADDATLTVNGGTFYLPVFALGREGNGITASSACSSLVLSDRTYYAADGDITFNINGGDFRRTELGAAQNTVGYTQVLRGDFTVNIAEGATFAVGTVVDATQVKAYDGADNKATLNYPTALALTPKRFDVVNGEAQTYDEPLRIACVGDSITQGTMAGNAELYSYPSQLRALIENAGIEVYIGNYGCGGSTVMPCSSAWYNLLLAYKIAMEESGADTVIVGLGSNDGGVNGLSLGQTERFEAMYEAFVRGFGELPETRRVMMTSVMYRGADGFSPLGNIATASCGRPLQKRVAARLTAENPARYIFTDLGALTLEAAVDGSLFSSDLLHPDAEGYGIYAGVIYDALFNGVREVENFEMTDIYLSASGREGGAGTKDDPTSSIKAAFYRAAPNTTLHVIGEYTLPSYLVTPMDLEQLTVVGEGEGAALLTQSNVMQLHSDTVFDNILLDARDTSGNSKVFYIACNYHSVTLGVGVTTGAKTVLMAGSLVYSADSSTKYYTTASSVSSDRDCTVTLLGGSFARVVGGNFRWHADAPIGTYSGSLTLNIGAGVTVADNSRNAICGENYLTGSITANVDAWTAGKPLREYAPYTALDGVTLDASRNTGSVTLNLGEGVSPDVRLAYDFDGDGSVTMRDALLLLRYTLNSFDTAKSDNFFGRKTASLPDVIALLQKLAK